MKGRNAQQAGLVGRVGEHAKSTRSCRSNSYRWTAAMRKERPFAEVSCERIGSTLPTLVRRPQRPTVIGSPTDPSRTGLNLLIAKNLQRSKEFFQINWDLIFM